MRFRPNLKLLPLILTAITLAACKEAPAPAVDFSNKPTAQAVNVPSAAAKEEAPKSSKASALVPQLEATSISEKREPEKGEDLSFITDAPPPKVEERDPAQPARGGLPDSEVEPEAPALTH